MSINDIPALNAVLNSLATVLIVAGLLAIRSNKEKLHRSLMVSALAVSALFLIGYVGHKIAVQGVHTKFPGEGLIAWVYYIMLISHIILAIAIVPLIGRTVWLAINDRRDLHKKWARVTYPIWLYVSVTGVLVYMFLYVWYPTQN